MRTKKISLLLALVLVISAIALPLTAYAAGDKDTTPPELTASLDGDTLKIESSDDNSGVEAAVSYTHLDVYKRQVSTSPSAVTNMTESAKSMGIC